jgi:hypothetical protein
MHLALRAAKAVQSYVLPFCRCVLRQPRPRLCRERGARLAVVAVTLGNQVVDGQDPRSFGREQ